MKPENIIEKIWKKHIVAQKKGHPAVLAIDFMLIHEVTSPQAFSMLREKGWKVKYPEKCMMTVDHSIPTRKDRHIIRDPVAKKQIETLRKNAEDFGIRIFDLNSGNQGIVHVIGPELGFTQPGMTIVCGDSHTATHGAFGALAFGVGTSEVGHVLATGCVLQYKPKTMKVEFRGKLRPGVTAKDAILALINQTGADGGTGYVIEYTGGAIRKMSMEERMTICNMSIECGARAGLIAPDRKTFEYLKGRPFAPKGEGWKKAVRKWKTLTSHPESSYDKEVVVDLNKLTPMITWGTNPGQGMAIKDIVPDPDSFRGEKKTASRQALDYTKLKPGKPIAGTTFEWGFIGSCTNGRLSDLREAAGILKNRKVHKNVTLYVVPGSEQVKAQAEKEGLDKIFIKSGAYWRNPGCSLCLGMNDDRVSSGKRCISSSNRNFIGRQGTGSITHLASPATVAISCIYGKITSPDSHVKSGNLNI